MAGEASIAEQVKKIGAAAIMGGSVSKALLDGQKSRELYSVVGIARGVDRKMNRMTGGTTREFKGHFETTNLLDGTIKQSMRYFAPDILADQLENALADAKGDVIIAVVVGIKESKSPVGFEYVCRAVEKISETDPFAVLKARLGDKLPKPALPAPAATGANAKK